MGNSFNKIGFSSDPRNILIYYNYDKCYHTNHIIVLYTVRKYPYTIYVDLFSSVLYSNYAGGVSAISKENFYRVNGFANDYWGWGSEDDDFSARYQQVLTFKCSAQLFLSRQSFDVREVGQNPLR